MNDIGEVIAVVRRAYGLTQEQVARDAGVTQAALSRYENGLREPEPDVLPRLARALGVTADFLRSSGRNRGAMAVDAHMRRRTTAKATSWRALEARLNMYRMHTKRLFEEVDMQTDQRIPTFDPIEVDAAGAARLVRMQWRMPIGPVRYLVRWLEAAGCVVVEEDFGTPRIDGMSQWIDEHPIMLINARAPTDRKRLTLAHELGHLCLHSEEVSEDMESEANAFAAEFLMPSEVIIPQLRKITLGRLHDLKREWWVSMQALIERAYGAKLLTVPQRTNLYKSMSARGWRTQEPLSDTLPPETPTLARNIGDALAARGLSLDDIAGLVGVASADHSHPFRPSRGRLSIV